MSTRLSFELNSFLYLQSTRFQTFRAHEKRRCLRGVAQFRAPALFTRFYLCFECGEKQRGRMLTRFLHDRAGIPWKEPGTALPRHRDTQLSLLSLMRDFLRPANSSRFLSPPFMHFFSSRKEIYMDKRKMKLSIDFFENVRRGG